EPHPRAARKPGRRLDPGRAGIQRPARAVAARARVVDRRHADAGHRPPAAPGRARDAPCVRRVGRDRGPRDRDPQARQSRARGDHRDANRAFEEGMTFGERVADQVAQFGGSWTFIGSFLLFMVLWMIVNGQLKRPFDPYPFILLNLCLSCLAALQAPVIMMSQNRQATKDRLMATNDYEVNLRSELGIHSLHTRFDELRERDWAELVQMQQRQIDLLEGIVRDRSGKGGSGT